ncbi:hypothetical protein CFOL_v3_06361 [Cephalotus follicularis]|uniref:Uncharacterized protein n=1 Tax=Cephalotus follicularis TaxID=3775 RepID=A0A1Q3B4C6_CEPFO|nr:hypothetical protein CFOL_v3_06361 [Cephalotus follicularis]
MKEEIHTIVQNNTWFLVPNSMNVGQSTKWTLIMPFSMVTCLMTFSCFNLHVLKTVQNLIMFEVFISSIYCLK